MAFDPPVLQTISTAIIAVATVFYVVCTILLWLSTRKAANAAAASAEAATRSADATTLAADASKTSADLLTDLHRPYMGVHQIALIGGANYQNQPLWQISWEIRNFGTLPALAVDAKLDFVVGATVLFTSVATSAAEVFPASDPVTTIVSFPFEGPRRDEVLNGMMFLIARITITYATSSGERYQHCADAHYNRGRGTFTVVKSQTNIA
jgi:hypothetical protein